MRKRFMAISIERQGHNIENRPSRRDVFESLRFATLVESNPEGAANSLLAAAHRDNADWLKRFVTECWYPEEEMHGKIFREYLVRSGAIQPADIDDDIRKVKERGFPLGEGYTALQACIYGWIQEMVTWRFYQSMQKHAGDPLLSEILNDVGKQENFHRHIYLTGANTILKHDPSRIREVIETVKSFEMPGHYMVPELQPQAPKWAEQFGFPRQVLFRDIAEGIIGMVGHKGLGEIILSYGSKNLPWYLKAPLAPLYAASKSPIPPTNLFVGKLADMATRKKK